LKKTIFWLGVRASAAKKTGRQRSSAGGGKSVNSGRGRTKDPTEGRDARSGTGAMSHLISEGSCFYLMGNCVNSGKRSGTSGTNEEGEGIARKDRVFCPAELIAEVKLVLKSGNGRAIASYDIVKKISLPLPVRAFFLPETCAAQGEREGELMRLDERTRPKKDKPRRRGSHDRENYSLSVILIDA